MEALGDVRQVIKVHQSPSSLPHVRWVRTTVWIIGDGGLNEVGGLEDHLLGQVLEGTLVLVHDLEDIRLLAVLVTYVLQVVHVVYNNEFILVFPVEASVSNVLTEVTRSLI